MPTITVQAAPGRTVPMEHDPRRHITDAAPVTVEVSVYYRRRMADGDLIQQKEARRGKS